MEIEVTTPIPEGCKDKHTQLINTFQYYGKWMGMDSWNIRITYATVDNNYVMETEQRSEYYGLYITVDLQVIQESQMKEYVRHELFHGLMGIYAEAVDAVAGPKARKALHILEERVTSDLERMPLWDILEKTRKPRRKR
jgi:hypothetical protein